MIKLIYSHQVFYILSTIVKEAWTKIKNKQNLNQALSINMLTCMTWKQQVIKDGLLKCKNGTVGATLSIDIVADTIGVITEIYITGWKYIIYIYSWCFFITFRHKVSLKFTIPSFSTRLGLKIVYLACFMSSVTGVCVSPVVTINRVQVNATICFWGFWHSGYFQSGVMSSLWLSNISPAHMCHILLSKLWLKLDWNFKEKSYK